MHSFWMKDGEGDAQRSFITLSMRTSPPDDPRPAPHVSNRFINRALANRSPSLERQRSRIPFLADVWTSKR